MLGRKCAAVSIDDKWPSFHLVNREISAGIIVLEFLFFYEKRFDSDIGAYLDYIIVFSSKQEYLLCRRVQIPFTNFNLFKVNRTGTVTGQSQSFNSTKACLFKWPYGLHPKQCTWQNVDMFHVWFGVKIVKMDKE